MIFMDIVTMHVPGNGDFNYFPEGLEINEHLGAVLLPITIDRLFLNWGK